MKILKIVGSSLLGFSLIAGLFIYQTYAAEIKEINEINLSYHYQIVEQSKNPMLISEEGGFLKLTIKNMGKQEWPVKQLFLNSIFFEGTKDRQSQFATSEWINHNRIQPLFDEREVIKTREEVSFNIPLKGVLKEGLYQEDFQPMLENIGWIDGEEIDWMIQVGDVLSYQSTEGKYIKIWLDDQRIWAIENHVVVLNIPTSTGKAGYDTPKGMYKIFNHIDVAYSSAYKLYMDNWMALSSLKYGFRGYGLHRLPYWRVNPARYEGKEGQVLDGRLYTEGKLYEDYAHLGKKMSHGCIRVGIETSQMLYDWADNGTLVEIA